MKCFISDKFMLSLESVGGVKKIYWYETQNWTVFAETLCRPIELETGEKGFSTHLNGQRVIIERSWFNAYELMKNVYGRLNRMPSNKEIFLTYDNKVSNLYVLIKRDGTKFTFEDMYTKDRLLEVDTLADINTFMRLTSQITKNRLGFEPYQLVSTSSSTLSREFRSSPVYGVYTCEDGTNLILHKVDLTLDKTIARIEGKIGLSEGFKAYRQLVLRLRGDGRHYVKYKGEEIYLDEWLFGGTEVYDFVIDPISTSDKRFSVVHLKHIGSSVYAVMRDESIKEKVRYRTVLLHHKKGVHYVTVKGNDIKVRFGV